MLSLEVVSGRTWKCHSVCRDTDVSISAARYDWVTSFKVQFSNDSQTWWKSRNSTGEDMVSGLIVVGTSSLGGESSADKNHTHIDSRRRLELLTVLRLRSRTLCIPREVIYQALSPLG